MGNGLISSPTYQSSTHQNSYTSSPPLMSITSKYYSNLNPSPQCSQNPSKPLAISPNTPYPPHTPPEVYYPIDCLLGEGAYSTVYRGYDHEKDQYLAIKKINLFPDKSPPNSSSEKSHQLLLSAVTEVKVYQRMKHHDFINQLHAAYPIHLTCYLIMNCLSTDLRRILKYYGTLPEYSTIYIVGCIGSALNHLHSHGILHRDVKPENISLDQEGRPYLTDFGISLVSTKSNPLPISTSTSGTLPYIAPEALAPGNCHSYQSDFWSLGVTAFELLLNRHPFYRMCPLNMVKFAANNYCWVWRELISQGESIDALTMLDFETIQNSDPSADLPFPDYEESLNSDGTVPSSLLPPIPDRCELYGISAECKSLLHGLMDVRLPLRLGGMLRFSEFMEHAAFLKHGYFYCELATIPSPLAGAGYLNRIPSQQPLTVAPPTKQDIKNFKEYITPEIKHLLSHFHYSSSPNPKPWHEELTESIRTKFTFRVTSFS